jgi:hypothetical protein
MIGASRAAGCAPSSFTNAPGWTRKHRLPSFSSKKSSRLSRRSSPGRPRSGWPIFTVEHSVRAPLPTMLTSSSTKSYLFSSVLDPYRFFLVSPLRSSLPSLGTDWWSLYLPLGENPQSPDILSPVPLKIVAFEASPSRGARPAWDLRIFTEPASSRNLLLSLLTPGGSNT